MTQPYKIHLKPPKWVNLPSNYMLYFTRPLQIVILSKNYESCTNIKMYFHNSKTVKMANQKSLNSTQVMTYNHNRHEILRKVSFSHCHLDSWCRSMPGTGHTSLCNICDKSPWFYCSCSVFAQHSRDIFEKRCIQDLHWDVRPGDDVRFPGWWDQALVCAWSPIGWFSYLSPCWKVSRHSHRQDQECCTELP